MKKDLRAAITPRQRRQGAALARARALFPSLKDFAKALDVSYQVVQGWERNGQVPSKHCRKVEQVTGGKVRRERLNETAYA